MDVELLIIGGGPAGLSAAVEAVRYGVDTLLVDDGPELGGQLIKQTHKFFGSKMEYAGKRGIEIPALILDQIRQAPNFRFMSRTTALGYYEDGAVIVVKDEKVKVIYPKRIIVATGASEKIIPFKNNDIPGVYGAGAVQTLMNVYGVLPGKRALMVGAGNIGLIVSYQLLQAGCDVAAIVEATSAVGGYWVHAAKVRRMGVPILTEHTIVEAIGKTQVEGATIARIDKNFKPVSGTEKRIDCDIICLAVGLSPLVDFLFYAGCRMVYIPELGGEVPTRTEEMETSVKGIYVAGDASGIEEASSAMLEGRLAGLSAARSLGYTIPDFEDRKAEILKELENLRKAPVAYKVSIGLNKLKEHKNARP